MGEVNTRCLGKGSNCCGQMDTALVAHSEEKLCRVVSEFGRRYERSKLQVNMGKSKVVKC